MMVSYAQLVKERLALGISQARLAKEAGINRTVLSSFETGATVLGAELTRKLVDYFAARGVELEDISGQSPTGERSASCPRVVDDVVIAPTIEDSRVEDLLAARAEARERIATLLEAPIEEGFISDVSRQSVAEHRELLLLFAREASLIRELRGEAPFQGPAEGTDPSTHAEWLAAELAELARGAEEAQAA